jgi:hypothetical protein
MKEAIALIALMAIVLNLILLIDMLLVELPKDQLDLPLDFIRITIRTPISSILYFCISCRK